MRSYDALSAVVLQLRRDFFSPLGGRTWRVTGQITDPGNDLLEITVDWGDGSDPLVIEDVAAPYELDVEYDFPPTGETYTVEVTVNDDDTGQYVWSDALDMYLLDIDNDADNNGEINEDDDPIEATPPAAFIGMNGDDDNDNEIPDNLDEGPVEGEDDLEPFHLAFAPVNHPEPEVDDYEGWYVALTFGSGGGTIWENSNRTGFVELVETDIGYARIWEVGEEADPIPGTLYLEANSLTAITLVLQLLNPDWFSVDGDTVVFTAIEQRRSILLFGYWPVTDIGTATRPGMLNEWKTLVEDYQDSGYNVIAFSPRFAGQRGTTPGVPDPIPYWGKGTGDLMVDYRDTSKDFWRIVAKWDPIAIMSFSRGNDDKSWELEEIATNWARDTWKISMVFTDNAGAGKEDVWLKPYIGGGDDDHVPPSEGLDPIAGNPPDPTQAANSTRPSNLPLGDIKSAIDAIFPPLEGNVVAEIDGSGSGDFVSNYMAYHVAWYRQWMHATNTDPDKQIYFSGHTHVGVDVTAANATTAVKKQLDVLIEALPP